MINFGFNRHTDKDNKDHFFALQELFEADQQWSQPINSQDRISNSPLLSVI